jgi:hypothetical protein
VRRLEYYLSLLPREESDIIRWFYFERASWADITGRTLLSQSTVQRRKKSGVEKLAGYFSMLDKLSAQSGDVHMEARFTGYAHEERYTQCMGHLKDALLSPGIQAMLYIVTGCDELWNAGADSFIGFETGEVVPQESITESFTSQGSKLLRLAYCYAHGVGLNQLSHIVNSYFPGLEGFHLELAIEAMRLAQLFGPKSVTTF